MNYPFRRFIISYGGTVRPQHTFYEPVCKAIMELELQDVAELRFIGIAKPEFLQWIQDNYFEIMMYHVAYMPYHRVVKFMSNSNMFLLATGSHSYANASATGKIWTYFESNSAPILHIAKEVKEDNHIKGILKQADRGMSFEEKDYEGIRDFIKSVSEEWLYLFGEE